MADRFPLLLVGALLLLGAVGAFVFQGAARGEFADTLSTYRSEPSGARALYLLAEESGLPVLRRHEDLAPVPAGVVPVLLGVDEGEPVASARRRRRGHRARPSRSPPKRTAAQARSRS